MAACDSTMRGNLNRGHGFLRFMLAAAVLILATAVHHVEGDGAGRTASRDRSQPDNPLDWQAKWITADRTDKDPLPIFRKSIRLGKPVRQATIHICGLGHYELTHQRPARGRPRDGPGLDELSQDVPLQLLRCDGHAGAGRQCDWRHARQRHVQRPRRAVHEVQRHVRPAETDLPDACHVRAMAQPRCIGSDETWKYALGPIVFTCIYGGEDYDARREQPGWDRPGFDDGAWSAAEGLRWSRRQARGSVCTAGEGGRLPARCGLPASQGRGIRGRLWDQPVRPAGDQGEGIGRQPGGHQGRRKTRRALDA